MASPATTVWPGEIDRFNKLAATWWNTNGPMKPLHVINAMRLGYVLEQIARCFELPLDDLHGLRIVDIRCGASLPCEPLAIRGARVVGIDAAASNVDRASWSVDKSVNYAASFSKRAFRSET